MDQGIRDAQHALERGEHARAEAIGAKLVNAEPKNAAAWHIFANALLEQRKVELDAKRRLIELNAVPRLELSNLEAQYKAAQAALAAAEAVKKIDIQAMVWLVASSRPAPNRSAVTASSTALQA